MTNGQTQTLAVDTQALDGIEAPFDVLCHNATVATMAPSSTAPYGLTLNGSVGMRAGKIAWVGASSDVPTHLFESCPRVIDCQKDLLTPGLIDCHTHLVYAGNRQNEFEMRLNGATYAEVAAAGGGIIATVKATREASEDELFSLAEKRLKSFMRQGVTTVEIKSGYGLTTEDEAKMLRVVRRLGQGLLVDTFSTFLGAHALPPEYKGRADDYIDLICEQMLPAIAAENLADAVDAFCENIAFSSEQVNKVFKVARQLGLAIKLHAEQLSDQKGAILAARSGALSVDHLEYLSVEDVAVLAKHGTVAVLLPGAFYFLNENKLPPIEALREQGVVMALASDHNPGSSPMSSILMVMNMACVLFKLTPEEALSGLTYAAAQALGVQDQIGSIEAGKQANLVLWNAKHPAELSYQIGGNPCSKVFYQGELILQR